MNKGKLVIISGPSGVGKGTLVRETLKRVPDIFLSVSATTRKPRPDEDDGRDYDFISEEQFAQKINDDNFLEWANVYSDRYGTPKDPIDTALAEGKLVILEIDIQGAMQVRDKVGRDASYIFIVPPSSDELSRRLGERMTETPESRKIRLDEAEKELEQAEGYDYIIVNDRLERAVSELCSILLRIKEDG